jgi:Family of unknown function (DUF5675)
MKSLVLERFAYSPQGTFGKLIIESTPFSCFTVERPWVDADGNGLSDSKVSCIPEGVYPIEPVVHHPTRPDGYPAYLLLNTGNRSAIHIHIANTMYDLEGCIGVGNILGASKVSAAPYPVWSVLNSASTFKQFMDTMAGDKGSLVIFFTHNRP